MTSHTIHNPRSGPSFSATRPLSIGTHPEAGSQWPAWAEVAFIHNVESSDDLYVTYCSDAETVAEPAQRAQLCGLSIEIMRLFFWDWGPVEVDINDVFHVEREGRAQQSPCLETEV